MFNQIFVSYLVRQNIIKPTQAQEVFLEILNNKKIKNSVRSAEEKLTMLKQVLDAKEYMGPEQFDISLDNFKTELGVDNAQFKNLRNNDIDTYLSCIAGISDGDYIMREYAKTFIAATINYISPDFFIKKISTPDLSIARYVVSQNSAGDASVTFMFVPEDSISATKFAETFEDGIFEVSDELDEQVIDSLKEFLNSVMGFLVSELFNKRKINLDIEAPEYHAKMPIDNNTIILPFSLLHIGEFYICIKRNY